MIFSHRLVSNSLRIPVAEYRPRPLWPLLLSSAELVSGSPAFTTCNCGIVFITSIYTLSRSVNRTNKHVMYCFLNHQVYAVSYQNLVLHSLIIVLKCVLSPLFIVSNYSYSSIYF